VEHVIRFLGPNHALGLFGVKLVGANAENAKKLLFTLVFLALMLLVSSLLRRVMRGVTRRGERTAFWLRQAVHVLTTVVLVLGIASPSSLNRFRLPRRVRTSSSLPAAKSAGLRHGRGSG